MTKKELLEFTSSHYKRMQDLASEMKKNMDEEAIHQFRVEYKKLRAMLRLFSTLPGFSKKIRVDKKLKRLYSICGEIRDLQLQQQRFKKATADQKAGDAYCRTLEKEIDALEPQLRKQLDKDPVSASKQQTDGNMPDEFTLHDFRRFARGQWSDIKTILRSGINTDDHLHTIRKHFKDLYYNLKLYEGAEYRLLQRSVLNKIDDDTMKKLLDQLGDFQDRSTSLTLLKTHWLNNYGIHTHLLLDNLLLEWRADHRQRYRELVTKMRSFKK